MKDQHNLGIYIKILSTFLYHPVPQCTMNLLSIRILHNIISFIINYVLQTACFFFVNTILPLLIESNYRLLPLILLVILADINVHDIYIVSVDFICCENSYHICRSSIILFLRDVLAIVSEDIKESLYLCVFMRVGFLLWSHSYYNGNWRMVLPGIYKTFLYRRWQLKVSLT